MSDSGVDRPNLSPSAIAQFFRLQSCPMYLQWRYDGEARERIHRRHWQIDELSPVLADEGDRFEREQLAVLDDGTREFYGPEGVEAGEPSIEFEETWEDDENTSRDRLATLLRNQANADENAPEIVVHQAHVTGTFGAYEISGQVDIIVIESTEDSVRARVFEVKSSSTQKVHHRYQAAIYGVLLEELLASMDLDSFSNTPNVAIVTPDNRFIDDLDDPDPFDIAPYRAKLQLKLEAGGSFDQTILHTSFEGTTNRIARRCSGCEFEPLCMTRGVESKGLELLGLQAGTQNVLHRLGIDDIEDFANLFEHPEEGSVQWEYSALTETDADLARRVRREADVSNLQKRSEIAYRFLTEIDDDYGRDGPDFYPYPLRGTGNNLPEDEHGEFDVDWTAWGGSDYPSGSLVRVYLHVQRDHAQDRVTMLSAYVACTLTDRDATVIELPETLPTTPDEKDQEEDRLFDRFFRSLTHAIDDAAPAWTEDDRLTDLDLEAGQGFLHLFIYSDDQRQALVDAIRRHPGGRWRRPLRTLLSLRSGIDQEMVSVIQDDFRKRWALRFPGLGLIQSTAQFRWDDWFDWRVTDEEGSTVDLSEIFTTGLFDSATRYHRDDDRLILDHSRPERSWTPEDKRLARWVYPVRNRETDQLPVEYLWGLRGRLDPSSVEDPENVYPFLFREGPGSERITEEDVELVAERFARAPHHIERTIESVGKYANDKFVNKQPIDLEELADFAFDELSIDEVCIEYQQLEYHTIREGLESYYAQPLAERVDSGASIRFRCTSVDEGANRIRGRLLEADGQPLDSGRARALAGRPLSVSGGDFAVLTRLTDDGGRPEAPRRDRDPTSIGNSTTVIVSSVDESTGTVSLTAPFADGWPRWGQYSVRHRGWSTDPTAVDEEWLTYVAPGEEYVVDPMFDQITQNRAHEALVNATTTPVRRWLRDLYEARRECIPVDRWEAAAVEDYLDQMADAKSVERPNPEQGDFATDVDHGIVMLQGPPGTGKTRYTVAPAVLGRVHADMVGGRGCRGVVSAVSHNAVNEALRGILDLYRACPPGESEDDVTFVRVCSSRGQGVADPLVRTVYYNDDGIDEELQELYDTYFAPGAPGSERVLFFGPPVSIRSFLNAMIREVDAFDYEDMADLMAQGDSPVFDLAIIDEASMMDLPLFLLLGSFVREAGQLALVGDHRQMQPIQQHDWEAEDREPIERHTPFLSALDFLRYLRGEDVELEYVDREPPDLEDPEEALPVHRLRETYRLPPESARLHTDLFYARDGIDLVSRSAERELPPVAGPLAEVLDTNDRVTLLLHDESQSQNANPVEQALIAELLSMVDVRGVDGEESEGGPDDERAFSAGVVVPFRAQRRDVVGVVPDGAAVDTVERFQGGERDLIILSMTASDRGYISQIGEFLLDPNRFNVGASRMKRKLVVIASAGLFEESSDDVALFERQQAWISFFQSMGGLVEARDPRPLRQLVGEEVWERYLGGRGDAEDVTIRVLSGYDRSA